VNEIDIQIFRFLHRALGGSWFWPMVALSAFGGGWGSLTVIPLLVWTRTRRFAGSLAAVLGVTALLVYVLKRMIGRVRPCGCLADVKALVFEPPTDFSFPSGHSAGSFAFALFVAIVLVKRTPPNATAGARFARRLAAFVLVLVAFGVALSRIALGVHFPGDVLAGAILGSTVAAIGANLFHTSSARPPETSARRSDGSASLIE